MIGVYFKWYRKYKNLQKKKMYENASLTTTIPLYANTSIYCRTHNSSRCFAFHHLSVLMLIERLLIQRVFICRNCYMDVARWNWISTKLYADRASNFKIPHVHKGTQRCARRLVNFSQTRKLLSVVIRADKFIGHKIVSRRIHKDYSENKNRPASIRLSSFFFHYASRCLLSQTGYFNFLFRLMTSLNNHFIQNSWFYN